MIMGTITIVTSMIHASMQICGKETNRNTDMHKQVALEFSLNCHRSPKQKIFI